GVALGLALLAGGIEVVVALALPLAAWCAIGGEARAAPARAGRVALGLALGAALAAVQLVPTSSFLGATSRGAFIPSEEALTWSTHPLRLLDAFAPAAFALEAHAPWSELFERNAFREPFATSIYVGAPLVVLAALGAAGDRRARAVGGGVLLLLLA